MKENRNGTDDSWSSTGETNPSTRASNEEAGFYELIGVAFRWRFAILVVFLAIFVAGIAYTYTRRKVYESNVTLVVLTNSEKSGGAESSSILGNLAELTQGRNVGTQVAILNSPELLQAAFEALPANLRSKGFGFSSGKVLIKQPWIYTITPLAETDAISITTSAFTREAAAALANGIAETYLNRDLKRNKLATRQGREYVEKEIRRTKLKLSAATLKVSQFKEKTGLIAPSEQVAKATDAIFDLKASAQSAAAEKSASAQQTLKLKVQLSALDPTVDFSKTTEVNPTYTQIASQLTELQAKRAELVQEFSAGSTDVRQVDGQIKLLEQRLSKVVKETVATKTRQRNAVYDDLLQQYAKSVVDQTANDARLTVLSTYIAKSEAALQKFPVQERMLAEYEDEVKVLQSTFDLLSARYYELFINEQSSLPNGFIASHSMLADDPSSPNIPKNITLFFLLALVLSFLMAFGLDKLDVRIHEPSEVERILGAPILSAIPETRHSGIRPILGELQEESSSFLESFRILRNNIAFSNPDKPVKILAVTSSVRAEGKSTTSINLAIAMAMDGKSVLLIDCDLRRPTLHTWLKVPRDVGLTNAISGQKEISEVIIPSGHDRLCCLLTGPLPPNPTEMLNSAKARELFKELTGQYDLVILDCPPCIGLSDVQVISTIVDSVVIVTSLSVSKKNLLRGTIQALRQAGAPVIGFVFNRLAPGSGAYAYRYGYYYGYYEYYNYSQDDESGEKPQERRSFKKKK